MTVDEILKIGRELIEDQREAEGIGPLKPLNNFPIGCQVVLGDASVTVRGEENEILTVVHTDEAQYCEESDDSENAFGPWVWVYVDNDVFPYRPHHLSRV